MPFSTIRQTSAHLPPPRRAEARAGPGRAGRVPLSCTGPRPTGCPGQGDLRPVWMTWGTRVGVQGCLSPWNHGSCISINDTGLCDKTHPQVHTCGGLSWASSQASRGAGLTPDHAGGCSFSRDQSKAWTCIGVKKDAAVERLQRWCSALQWPVRSHPFLFDPVQQNSSCAAQNSSPSVYIHTITNVADVEHQVLELCFNV